MEIRIVLNGLMEPLERIIEIWHFCDTMNDRIKSHLHTIVNLEVVVLHLILVDVAGAVCSSESLLVLNNKSIVTLINSVAMDSP